MKKERQTLCERYLQFAHPKKYCRSDRELCKSSAKHLQERRMHNCRGTFASTVKKHTRQETKKICEEYKMEATIQSKMRLDKCNAYTVKETLGFSVAAKRRKTEGRRRNKPTDKL